MNGTVFNINTTIMKKIGLAIIVALATLQAKAQVTDLKILANKTPNEIIALYGNPEQIDN